MEAKQTKWWKKAVVYQIYPRSFCDSNGDGIGDIPGITSKLDYLKTLGIDVIWLSPVYASPGDDNGYDISDYRAINPEFGTMANFDEMLRKAHQLGIKILMDLVVNHTSDEHEWFIESRKNKDNPYRDFYYWRDGKNSQPPNNWGSVFSGPAWEYDEGSGQYYLHLFSKKQPDLNWENPAVRKEVYEMMCWWLDKGVDGFRMDVISMISKVPGLPDGNVSKGALYGDFGPFSVHGPRVHEFIREMNREVLSKYDIMTVGETAGVTIDEATKYASGDLSELSMIFQFEHSELVVENGTKWSDKIINLRDLKKVMAKWQTELSGKAWNSLYWENHDQPRSVSRYGDTGEYWEKSAKTLAVSLHMMQGTPYIYQGQEIGMTNTVFNSPADFRDLEAINAYREFTAEKGIPEDVMMRRIAKEGRDNSRTPMQWDGSAAAGFTSGKPWIETNPNYKNINTEKQVGDPDSIFAAYQAMIKLRHKLDVITDGTFTLLDPDSENTFSYLRENGKEKLLVVCNFTKEEISFSAPFDLQDFEVLYCNYQPSGATSGKELTLRPWESVIYYQAN
ncbi:MAG: alpha-glucosidase [Lachnospiraceae bacterium]|nr:alpha-glucosidase [Lachnospiraceae bacterium]